MLLAGLKKSCMFSFYLAHSCLQRWNAPATRTFKMTAFAVQGYKIESSLFLSFFDSSVWQYNIICF